MLALPFLNQSVKHSLKQMHYANSKKSKIFQLFNAGMRPSDISEAPVTRKTLYRYYGEWRGEKSLPPKPTGFAIKKFNRKAQLEKREYETQQRAMEGISRLVMDWEAILKAVEEWDGDFEHTGRRLYLPGRREYRWLRHCLRIKKEPGRVTYMTRKENLSLYQTWVEAGRQARNMEDFRRRCLQAEVGLPAEIKYIRP